MKVVDPEGVDRQGDATAVKTVFIGYLVIVAMWSAVYNMVRPQMRDERLAGSKKQLLLGWFNAEFMQYSVYGVLGVKLWTSHEQRLIGMT